MNNPSSMPSASGSHLNYTPSNRNRNSTRITEDLINLLPDPEDDDDEDFDPFANLGKQRERSSQAFSVRAPPMSTVNKNAAPRESRDFGSYSKEEIQLQEKMAPPSTTKNKGRPNFDFSEKPKQAKPPVEVKIQTTL